MQATEGREWPQNRVRLARTRSLPGGLTKDGQRQKCTLSTKLKGRQQPCGIPNNLATKKEMLNKVFFKKISTYIAELTSKSRIKSPEAKNEARARIQGGELTLKLVASLRHLLSICDLEILF